MNYTTYPLGFIGPEDATHADKTPHERIKRLCEEYIEMNNDIDLKALRLAILEEAQRVFNPWGGFTGWVEENFKHAQLTRLGYEFLRDCLRYALTGKRHIDIIGWGPLLLDAEKDRGHQVVKVPVIEDTLKTSDSVLADWLKHPMGFQDMVWSLQVIFALTNGEGY